MSKYNRRRVTRWESGKETPSWPELVRIAHHLHTTPEQLAECDRAEYERTFPTPAARGVPWWRRWRG